jgi:hypothetical protein
MAHSARSYLASGSGAFAPATLAEHITWQFGEFSFGGRIAQRLVKSDRYLAAKEMISAMRPQVGR